jgi:hypothetical protein
MRLHFGPVPESPEFQPEATGWRPLREPSPAVFVWIGTAVGLVAGAAMIVLWVLTASDARVISVTLKAEGSGLALVLLLAAAALLSVLLLIVVHELLHAAVFPGGWLSPRTILGVWPAMAIFYAHYDGPQSRNRFLLVGLMPVLVLTLGLWLVDLIFPTGWGGVLAVYSVLNAMFAGGDLVGAAITAAQVPANAEIRNQGWKTWWRVPTVDAEEPARAAAASVPPEAVQET